MAMTILKSFRQSGKKRFSFVPTLCTLVNALFGFLAVIKALEGDFLSAAYCILCAAFMDMIDGRIARFFDLASAFGMELDSLCDAVSFCFVPVIVMYCWCLHTQGLLGLLVLAFYLWCGLFRLARFNLTAVADARYFVGLPTTFSALCLASLLVHMPDACSAQATTYCRLSMLVMSMLALLMVSHLRFPACKRVPSRLSRKLFLGLLCCIVCIAGHQLVPVLMLLAFGYILISSAVDLCQRIKKMQKRSGQ